MWFFWMMHFIMIQMCFYDTKIDYVKYDNEMVTNMKLSCLLEQLWTIHSKHTSISLSGGIDNLQRLTLLLFKY
jgi:hypothetical protein